MNKILIIGSTNMDIAAKLEHLPKPGETVGDATLFRAFGGKGANQAVAAARAGGDVGFIGCIGNDANGQQMKTNLKKEGINTDFISVVPKVASGTALIFVDNKGENCIAVAPGANNHVTPSIIDNIEHEILAADLILLQLEIPYSTVQHICKLASNHNKKVLLNPAPAMALDRTILNSLEYLILNETEIEMISGIRLDDNNISNLCEALRDKGPKNIIVTLGSKGSYIYNDNIQEFVEGFTVDAADTTGAGDTFCGAFAAATTKYNLDILESVQFANAAGALSVTKNGAQSSIPIITQIEEFIKNANKLTFNIL